MLLVSHKFQNMYMHIYLCCKSRILVPDDGPQVPKHVAFTDGIRRLLCLTVTNKPVLLTQHNGMNSIKIYLLPPRPSTSDGVNIILIGFQTSYVSELPARSYKNALYISGDCFAKFKQCRALAFATVSAALDFNR
jgi:hypothetical protein